MDQSSLSPIGKSPPARHQTIKKGKGKNMDHEIEILILDQKLLESSPWLRELKYDGMARGLVNKNPKLRIAAVSIRRCKRKGDYERPPGRMWYLRERDVEIYEELYGDTRCPGEAVIPSSIGLNKESIAYDTIIRQKYDSDYSGTRYVPL